jgi:hypothetical protein
MKELLPLIRKVVPGLIAQDIVGVQPMQAPVGKVFTMKSKYMTYNVLKDGWDKTCPPGHSAIETNVEIAHWIEQQPIHMWKYIDLQTGDKTFQLNTYFFVSNELLTWLRMRWE